MHADASRTGASFVAKRSPANPRQMLVDMIEGNPGASKDYLFDKFRELISEDDDCMRAVAWYFFVNFYEYETTTRNRKPNHQGRVASQARQRVMVERIKQKIILMDLILPSGKRLGDSTFADCAKAGGWFAKLARSGKPGQIVGKVLTEAQLKKLK